MRHIKAALAYLLLCVVWLVLMSAAMYALHWFVAVVYLVIGG